MTDVIIAKTHMLTNSFDKIAMALDTANPVAREWNHRVCTADEVFAEMKMEFKKKFHVYVSRYLLRTIYCKKLFRDVRSICTTLG